MIFVIYGINGVGKDSIVDLLLKEDEKFVVVSQSRLLMYHLGFVERFTVKSKSVNDGYEKLESISEKRINVIRNEACYNSVLELSNSGKIVLYLSHLTVARFFQEEVSYTVPEIPIWVKTKVDGLVLISADKKDIANWRRKDLRKRSNSLIEVCQQQRKEEKEWLNLIGSVNIPCVVIKNEPDKMEKATEKLKKFIWMN